MILGITVVFQISGIPNKSQIQCSAEFSSSAHPATSTSTAHYSPLIIGGSFEAKRSCRDYRLIRQDETEEEKENTVMADTVTVGQIMKLLKYLNFWKKKDSPNLLRVFSSGNIFHLPYPYFANFNRFLLNPFSDHTKYLLLLTEPWRHR